MVLPTNDSHLLVCRSYEPLLESLLMRQGFEVARPSCEHGLNTDLYVVVDQRYLRVEVKTTQTFCTERTVENRHPATKTDMAVIFARDSQRGIILAPAPRRRRWRMGDPNRLPFKDHGKSFRLAFRRALEALEV